MEFVSISKNRYQLFLERIPILGKVVSKPLGAIGFIIVLVFIITVIFAPLIAPYDYDAIDIPNLLSGPSPQYLLGTDQLGRDLFSRLVYGSRIAFVVAVPTILIAIFGGIVVGLLAGYFGGTVDNILLVLMDTISAFPGVVLALAVLALLGSSLTNVVLIIGLTWIPGYARVVRGQVLAAREENYVEAVRSVGASDFRITFSHILPNVIAPILILAAMDIPYVITAEAGLSFLGLGAQPPTPSWGIILSDGFKVIRSSPWPILWASLTLMVTTLGFTLFGEALRDVLDPRLSDTEGLF